MPEIWEGKNVVDFVDADIEAKLQQLEEEEEVGGWVGGWVVEWIEEEKVVRTRYCRLEEEQTKRALSPHPPTHPPTQSPQHLIRTAFHSTTHPPTSSS